VHSALERQDSAVQPSGDQVTRLKTFLLQSGNPLDLVVNVEIADSVLQRPLILLVRPSDRELGQVEEIGPLGRRLDIEECPLPVFAGLDNVRSGHLVLAG
jgi:hypothetical protein